MSTPQRGSCVPGARDDVSERLARFAGLRFAGLRFEAAFSGRSDPKREESLRIRTRSEEVALTG